MNRKLPNAVVAVVGAAVVLIWSPQPRAMTISVEPTDDGFIQGGNIGTDSYVFVVEPSDREARAIVEFPTSAFIANAGDISQARFSLNPYALPLFLPDMRVYGYESNNGQLDLTDYGAGMLLGVWTLPVDLDYGVEAFFDVTDFLRGAQSAYVGFRLEGVPVEPFFHAANVFSSLEFNYGTPPRLLVTISQPGTLALLGLGVLGLGVVRRRLV
jgi:hypothetical protein